MKSFQERIDQPWFGFEVRHLLGLSAVIGATVVSMGVASNNLETSVAERDGEQAQCVALINDVHEAQQDKNYNRLVSLQYAADWDYICVPGHVDNS